MRELELPKSLGNLHAAQDKINHALEKVDRVNQTIGISAFPNRRFDLSNLQGELFLDVAVKVGMVKESLEERAKPTLLFQKEKIEREIGNFDRIQKAQEKVERIRQFVEKTYLPESALKEAERSLVDLTQSLTPPSNSSEEQRPVIVGRRGRNRIEARPSGVLAVVVGVGAENAEEKPFVLPDGQEVFNLTEHEKKILSSLFNSSKSKPMSSSDWARSVYGNEEAVDVAFNRISVSLPKIRRKIADNGWQIENLNPRGKEGSYYLAQAEKDEEKEKIKKAKVELELPDGKKLANLGKIEKALIEGLLIGTEKLPVTTSELAELVYGDRVPKNVAVERFHSSLGRARKRLDSVGWQVVNKTPETERWEGKEGLFYLAQKEAVVKDDKGATEVKKKKTLERDRSLKLIEVKLSDGQVVRVRGNMSFKVLERLIQTSENNQIATDELAHIIFNKSDRIEVSQTRAIVDGLQEKLESVSWRIVKVGGSHAERRLGNKMKYYLEKVADKGETTPVVEGVSPEAPKISQSPIIGPIEGQGGKGEYTEIPYEQSEKEKRTEEETKILDVITSSLLASTRMRFEEVQRQLYTPDRTKPLLGGEAIFIYQSQELIENFNSAFRKIREEAEIATLREKWDDKENEMHEKLESLMRRFNATEVRDFLRRISEEIRRSERQFYADYPPESGNKVTWVRKDSIR